MKRLIITVLVLLLLTGCTKQNNTEEDDMSEIKYSGNKCAFNLGFSDGTGFEWMVAYISDNLKVTDSNSRVDREDPASAGGRGFTQIECELTDGSEAILILKYGRPWENDGSFNTYLIKADNGIITDIQKKEHGLYLAFDHEHAFRGDDYLFVFFLKDWNIEEGDNEEKVVFKLKPADEEGWITFSRTEGDYTGDTFRFAAREIVCGEGFIYRTDGVLCDTSEAPWAPQRFFEILEMLDLVNYE